MISEMLSRFLGTRNEREIKKRWRVVERINYFFESYKKLRDEEIVQKTEEFVDRLADGESVFEILPEAFALVKETARRLLGYEYEITGNKYKWDMVHFDVQLIGGIVLFEGKIAEMKTGEGKTLVATLPAYLHALISRARGKKGDKRFLVNGKPVGAVHIVTVNDYLARRDAQWMAPLYLKLGLSVSAIQSDRNDQIIVFNEEGKTQIIYTNRKSVYQTDITYGTNNEFGFDYLRDHMAFNIEDVVQRAHYYAIVDEVDSILIDEARTPLIISGPVEHSSVEHFYEVKPFVSNMVEKQKEIIRKFLDEVEKLLKEDIEKASIRLLQVRRGDPKNKRLFKILQEPGVLRTVDKIELKLIKEKKLREYDKELYFIVDEKHNTIDITEKGRDFLESRYRANLFKIPDLSIELEKIERSDLPVDEKFKLREELYREYAEKTDRIHAIQQMLKGYMLFEKDVNYVVKDNQVIIVDEFTGRMMPGRRWSDGLHEAIEAKEGVKVQEQTQTLATITLQNYFRLYEKLAGMTGTAITEAAEFWDIYKLDVIAIPTNKPVRRIDYVDIIFKTKKDKYLAVVDEIERWHKLGRPILVGTTSIEESELLSRLLKLRGIKHEVLNAKHHEKEAKIIAKAGQKYAVTISTNMAGRGTDIRLQEGVISQYDSKVVSEIIEDLKKKIEKGEVIPGHWKEIIKLGYIPEYDENNSKTWGYYGLYVIGTNKHEARRIDNQLRGRSGRQGDPGASKFFLSLEDDLLRLFGSDKVIELNEKLGKYKILRALKIAGEDVVESKAVLKALEGAQKRVEMMHFQIRKRLLEYDDVINKQREVVYSLREDILNGKDLREMYIGFFEDYLDELIEHYLPKEESKIKWNMKGLADELSYIFLGDFKGILNLERREDIKNFAMNTIKEIYAKKEEVVGYENMRNMERWIALITLDEYWREHLYALDQLKEGVYLRAYGNKDPLVEFKKESYYLFDEFINRLKKELVMRVLRADIRPVAAPTTKQEDSENKKLLKGVKRIKS
ncbi:MAG: preprotein translocase subunit SecA [candidate division WOR-3 bacterium]|nr:preprotein translocase subunit SecA [candidate division WOR-3 bacterium]